jgi:hypothetical protein
LSDVDGTDQDHAKRGVEGLVEDPRLRFSLRRDACIEPEGAFDLGPLRVGFPFASVEQTLLARLEIRGQHDRPLALDVAQNRP